MEILKYGNIAKTVKEIVTEENDNGVRALL